MSEVLVHPFPAEYDPDSKVLILGSFPSVKSREYGFYYMHPQNRFWKVLAEVYEEDFPKTKEERKEFVHRLHIALWDVIESCRIKGSSDASITDVKVNDIESIVKMTNIHHICCTGSKAADLFQKYVTVNVPMTQLPSTSSANAAWSLEKLVPVYQGIRNETEKD